MDFPLPDTAYEFRALRQTTPIQRGWDVFSLQTGLLGVRMQLPKHGPDGYLGDETSKAIWLYQERRGLKEDGIAGTSTQRAIALQFVSRFSQEYQIVQGLMHGQIEQESAFILGNHSAAREDGHRDCGVCQRNDEHTPREKGFDSFDSVRALARHLRTYFEKYRSQNVPIRRSWELAAGAWNAPAWADRLAKGDSLTDSQLAHLSAYIEEVTVYCKWS